MLNKAIFAILLSVVQAADIPRFTSRVTSIIMNNGGGYVDGNSSVAKFNFQYFLEFVDNEQAILVADAGNGKIRKVDLVTGDTTTCKIHCSLISAFCLITFNV